MKIRCNEIVEGSFNARIDQNDVVFYTIFHKCLPKLNNLMKRGFKDSKINYGGLNTRAYNSLEILFLSRAIKGLSRRICILEIH